MTNVIKRRLGFPVLSAVAGAFSIVLAAGSVRAEPDDVAPPPSSSGGRVRAPEMFALRAGVGAGAGTGLATRAGGVAELWPLGHVGVGVDAAISHNSNSNWAEGGIERGARTLSPFLGLRVAAPHTGWFVLHLGAGYADAWRTRVPPICFDILGAGGGCEDPVTTRFNGLAAYSALGWEGHLRENPFEGGVFGRFEMVMDRRGDVPTSYAGTLNVEVGLGI